MMASFVIMEAPDNKPGAPEEKIEVIRDGYSFLAFLFPFIWLLWHRLWFEAVLVLAAGVVAVAISSSPAFATIGSAIAILIRLYTGLEGNNLRVSALRRRGWRDAGIIDAASSADAEIRFFTDERDAIAPAPINPAPSSSNRMAHGRPSAAPSGPALGMLTLPGRR